MWYVYCLENKSKGYRYVGISSNLKRRLREHKEGRSKSTKPFRPLTLSAYIAIPTREQARNLEKYFKSGSGKAILKKRILQSEA